MDAESKSDISEAPGELDMIDLGDFMGSSWGRNGFTAIWLLFNVDVSITSSSF